jgi:hypothetical protein
MVMSLVKHAVVVMMSVVVECMDHGRLDASWWQDRIIYRRIDPQTKEVYNIKKDTNIPEDIKARLIQRGDDTEEVSTVMRCLQALPASGRTHCLHASTPSASTAR